METLVMENYLHMLHQIKTQLFYTDLGLYQQYLVLQKIEYNEFQGFWVIFQYFQGSFNFQGLFNKKALQIQVLFKPVGTLKKGKWQ